MLALPSTLTTEDWATRWHDLSLSPLGSLAYRNEPWRRVCEIRRILAGHPVPYTRPHGGH